MINLKLIREVTRDKMVAFEMIHIPLKEAGMASRKKTLSINDYFLSKMIIF